MFRRLAKAWMALDHKAERYQEQHRAKRARTTLPKCPFCHKQDFRIVRAATLVNSRIKSARVRMGVQCINCGMRMTASRHHYSSRWTFWESD